MISVSELKKLMPRTMQEIAKSFEPSVIAAASQGKTEVQVHCDELEREAYSRTQKWDLFVSYMKGLGYTVEYIYEERQFVHMAILIKWL
jgi:hypothetical protein